MVLSELQGQSGTFGEAAVAFTAGTMYTDPRDPRFEQGALEFAEKARDALVPFVAVDNSPPNDRGVNWVREALEARDAIVLPAIVGGIATQRQQGVAYCVANGATRVVGTEAEKPDLVRFSSVIGDHLGAGQTIHDPKDLLVIGRSPESKATLPPTQRWTEDLAGWILQQTHNLPPDSLAGPRGFSSRGAEFLASYPATAPGMNNWIYLYQTVIDGRGAGASAGGLELGFHYQAEIVADETGNPAFDRKRFEQFRLQLAYLLAPEQLDPGPSELREGDEAASGTRDTEYARRSHEIAHFTLDLLQDLNPETPNSLFVDRISTIERQMRDVYGYVPRIAPPSY